MRPRTRWHNAAPIPRCSRSRARASQSSTPHEARQLGVTIGLRWPTHHAPMPVIGPRHPVQSMPGLARLAAPGCAHRARIGQTDRRPRPPPAALASPSSACCVHAERRLGHAHCHHALLQPPRQWHVDQANVYIGVVAVSLPAGQALKQTEVTAGLDEPLAEQVVQLEAASAQHLPDDVQLRHPRLQLAALAAR
eukprot:scaffold21275_cov125-Isochrysis_galbana.AAC.2